MLLAFWYCTHASRTRTHAGRTFLFVGQKGGSLLSTVCIRWELVGDSHEIAVHNEIVASAIANGVVLGFFDFVCLLLLDSQEYGYGRASRTLRSMGQTCCNECSSSSSSSASDNSTTTIRRSCVRHIVPGWRTTATLNHASQKLARVFYAAMYTA